MRAGRGPNGSIVGGVTFRPGPRELRASDADRELVITLLAAAAGDGRITLAEHSERADRAYAARTLGELASLTTDLAPPDEQPFRIASRRGFTAIGGREHRDGRWVVPDRFPVTAVCGDVVLDLRDAVFQSQRVVILATAICGQIRLIVPEGVAVHMVGRALLGVRSVRGRRNPPAAEAACVIEVRTSALAGRVSVVTPRRSRWPRSGLRRTVTGR